MLGDALWQSGRCRIVRRRRVAGDRLVDRPGVSAGGGGEPGQISVLEAVIGGLSSGWSSTSGTHRVPHVRVEFLPGEVLQGLVGVLSLPVAFFERRHDLKVMWFTCLRFPDQVRPLGSSLI